MTIWHCITLVKGYPCHDLSRCTTLADSEAAPVGQSTLTLTSSIPQPITTATSAFPKDHNTQVTPRATLTGEETEPLPLPLLTSTAVAHTMG